MRPALLLALLAVSVPAALAQRPFQTLDPFYQDEVAGRAFYDGFAVSGEAVYRPAGLLPGAPGERTSGDVALSARADYALLPMVDLGLVFDLTGGVGRGPVGLSWVVLKPFWNHDGTDYAVRLAIDPASEGGLGFRQTDLAFLTTQRLSPLVQSDFSLGIRRVRTGVQGAIDPTPDPELLTSATFDVRTRVLGKELHGTWAYRFLLDPAGSHLTLGLLGDFGDYALLETASVDEENGREVRLRSGLVWLRAGLSLQRPGYVASPHLAFPAFVWGDVRGETSAQGPRPEKVRLGLRLTLR
jgi:hypothetical protein